MPTYYLRKEPHDRIIPGMKKTDGTIIPERHYMTDDLALYKDNRLSRFYRDYYQKPHNPGVHLYTAKTLKTIITQRKALFDYCGEWFDVYNENGIVAHPEAINKVYYFSDGIRDYGLFIAARTWKEARALSVTGDYDMLASIRFVDIEGSVCEDSEGNPFMTEKHGILELYELDELGVPYHEV